MKYNMAFLIVCMFFVICGVFETAAIAGQQDATGVVYNDVNGNGVQDAREVGIAKVAVSNGTDVVTTDSNGQYKLLVTDDCIIFVIKPVGWKTQLGKNNLPRFYYINKPAGSDSQLKFPGIAPTGAKPTSIDFPLQRQQESDKFDVILFGDIQTGNEKEVIYFRRQLAEVINTKAAFGISLGDNAGNNLSVLDSLNQAVAMMNLPWYNVAGNHDMNFLAEGDSGSLDTFKRIYGPVNYSFNYGKVHFIVLDSIIAKRTEKKHLKYNEGINTETLTFIANDLKHVSNDKLVVLLMHGGLHSFDQGRDKLLALLKDFDQSLSIAGHDHLLHHIFYDESHNFHGPKPHHHYIAGAVCGGWWMGTPDPYSDTPHSMMCDGAPAGYTTLNLKGNDYSLKYKAFGKDDDFQMTVYAPDEVKMSQLSETKVSANIFAASEKAVVKMNIDDGKWLAMKASKNPDPYFVKMRKWEDEKNIYRYSWAKGSRSLHIWEAVLPKNLSEGLHIINIKSTDMFGQTFAAKRLIKVTE